MDFKKAINDLDIEAIATIESLLIQGINQGKKIFVVGNGGSLSIGEHFVSDLIKGADKNRFIPMNIECLGSNQVELTADINDTGVETCFVNMLKRRIISEGDILVTFSVSGTSPNIVNVREYADSKDMTVISFVGNEQDDLDNEVSLVIISQVGDTFDYGIAEGMFSCVAHVIARRVREILSDIGK